MLSHSHTADLELGRSNGMPFIQDFTSVAKSVTNDSNLAKVDKKNKMGLVQHAVLKIEQKRMAESMEGVKGCALPKSKSPTSSVETSPTDSGTVTPRKPVTIAPSPPRYTSLVPPKNFGAVENGTIYRSGFPEPQNIEFLETMKLRAILTLVETEAEFEVQFFIDRYNIKHVTAPIVANKEGEIRSTHDSLCTAILMAIDPTHHPIHIHCNRGKHRTGCIVACIRKIQRWPIEDVLAEYDTYSNPKGRPEDIELIRSFDPESVFDYAKKHGMVEVWPREDGMDPPANVWELAAALPPHFLVETPSTISEISVDEEFVMTSANIDPRDRTYALDDAGSDKTMSPQDARSQMSVEEVDGDNVVVDEDGDVDMNVPTE